eukprot:2015707-Prymnesium_polylepis.1
MCIGTQYGNASPWISFGGDNFVTLAVKSVIVADTLSELVQLLSYSEGNREGRTIIGTLQLVWAMLGDLINLCILLYASIDLAFFQGNLDESDERYMNVGQWAGFLGCIGETSAFFLPAFVSAVLLPFMCVALFMLFRTTCAGVENAESDGAKCLQIGIALLVFGFACVLVMPSLGFIVFLFAGIPAVFPMAGLLICACVTAIVMQLILLIPDLMLSRLSEGEQIKEETLMAKMGLALLATVLACLTHCPIVYSQGIGEGYNFYFATLGAMPVHEEFGNADLELDFGSKNSPDILENTLPVVAYLVLIKLIGHMVLHLVKCVRAVCCASQGH